MTEKIKLFVILGFIATLIITAGVIVHNDSKEQQEDYNKFLEVFNSKENKLVYIGRPACSFCELLNPSLEDMKERYKFDYLYLNTDEISDSTMSKILKDLGLTSVGTPFLGIISNGKLVASQTEYKDYDVTFEFLQTNKIINQEATLLLNYIDLDEYKQLLAEDEKNIIVIGQSLCSDCVQVKLILNNIVEDKNIDINYLNVSYLSDKEGVELEETLEYLQLGRGTPLMLLTKNGELVDKLEQLVSEEDYIKFLEKNGVL